ncbi:MAG: HPr kinase/phosphorylase [Spirochaetes bacterium]|nr:HPr kinase/phosphorylase [Spirochaetota bacterium]
MDIPENGKCISIERLLQLGYEAEDLLHLRVLTKEETLKKEISTYDINRPGLTLAGDYDYFDYEKLQIFGRGEYSFLMRLIEEGKLDSLYKFFSYSVTCCIFSHSNEPPDIFIKLADKETIPVLVSSLPTNILTTRLTKVLEDEFAPRTSIHGVLVEVFGVGILIIGKSGVGKSECALELIERGHRLVADDVVEIRSIADTLLVGSGAKLIQHHMEIRGLGILNINYLFGVRGIRDKKQIQLVISLVEWDAKAEYDRLGLEKSSYSILGVEVPMFTLPVKPGRNIPILIESAAMNYRLLKMGYDSAKDFEKRLEKRIQEEKHKNNTD